MHILITGACGFIGSCFAKLVRKERPDWEITVLDALTYAGNLANLEGLDQNEELRFVRGDIAVRRAVEALYESLGSPPDTVVNFAAESHVDRSILGPSAFIDTNVNGTFTLLEQARHAGCERFLQVSTDEVYGSLGDTGAFTEESKLNPNSPYSASKASADLIALSYHRTFGMDVVVTRCSNNYGPYQFPEKLIPLMTLNSFEGKELPVYGAGKNVRDWIHVEDHCRGILAALERGHAGEVYNFGAERELTNLEIVERIADASPHGRDRIRFVKDRPGHDWRYAMDNTKVRDELGWSPLIDFDAGLEATVAWYRDNEAWWRPILTGEYMSFYEQWYEKR
jgi:dTDP-glucose 4,6-dehydratase